jgi:hypothetical protein
MFQNVGIHYICRNSFGVIFIQPWTRLLFWIDGNLFFFGLQLSPLWSFDPLVGSVPVAPLSILMPR